MMAMFKYTIYFKWVCYGSHSSLGFFAFRTNIYLSFCGQQTWGPNEWENLCFLSREKLRHQSRSWPLDLTSGQSMQGAVLIYSILYKYITLNMKHNYTTDSIPNFLVLEDNEILPKILCDFFFLTMAYNDIDCQDPQYFTGKWAFLWICTGLKVLMLCYLIILLDCFESVLLEFGL